MPVIVLRVDSNPNSQPNNKIPYEIKKQPLTLKMVSINFYDPATNLGATDPYTKNLYVDFSFLNQFSVITNGGIGGHGLVIPVVREEHSQILNNLDFVFEPQRDIELNFTSKIMHRISSTRFEEYQGYYSDPTDDTTLVSRHVSMAFFFEYDVIQFES